MATQLDKTKELQNLVISWEALPDDFQLEDEPVENTGQPILAGALRESLEISGFIQPQMLIASNFGLCATINGQLILKAPDWLYVPSVNQVLSDRKSYTPNLQGDVPAVVMEFLSDTEGEEYSVKRTYPPGKWFFYEQILQVPVYVIFDPNGGLLEFYQLENGRYELKQPDENGRHWISAINLFLGTWQGIKEARTGYWLRWWDQEGNLLPWAVELIEQERQEKERLMAYLRSQNIDPNNLPI
ncbi:MULTISPECIES: Uma2 family endonuclease [unclassified Nodularia (in: cyanobacteria)]|uniref:Uma2 family endonuclease n=1 Tax=unclassified Nodularia (in: cyanobacteria) TaxID=2656917 RepID=UPI00187DF25B|nr:MULTISPECIES: Uma2 family endonuclease [unclassified Nodularia (in: cyanobacteria)]MBE9198260.1 Uma2 family endonuclease [Nodularia sp. LEGE 06071]MCC2695160.1 Uma2 family endonuclease [Nodularia sp. LEGE 04288]